MQPDTFYHIYNHANGSENIFREERNYFFFLRRWAKFIEPVAGTYAYCLMPNHFHFLIRTHSEDEIQELIQESKTSKVSENLGGLTLLEKKIIQPFSNLFNSYTKAFNTKYNRKGSLFIPRFKRKEIPTEEYLTAIVHYIHHNPIHHGFCQNFEDWPHSSYHLTLSNKPTRLKRKYLLEWFGNIDEFISYHKSNIQLPEQSLLIDM